MPQAAGHLPIHKRLYVQVLIGIVAGVLLGWLRPDWGVAMKPLGDGFIMLIRMVIAPIVFGTVVVGIAKMGDMKEVGRIGAKTLIYFEIVSTLALVIGLLVVSGANPGAGVNADATTLDPKAVAAYTTTASHLTTIEFLMNIIPTTVVDAFARGEILQILLFSILFALALLQLREKGRPLVTVIALDTRQMNRILNGETVDEADEPEKVLLTEVHATRS
jgi:aerobic C4-dicarboxylate transport protein